MVDDSTTRTEDPRLRMSTGRRRRLFQYHVTIYATVLISGLAAFATSILWPLQGQQIQASFFLSLASSCLTLFGLVFTLCLIGTQFMAARTNVVVRRIFGVGTWLYLFLFVVTTLWTLAISYRAGDTTKSTRMCSASLLGKHCLSENQAARVIIFGVTWSLLLLLPFILYIYRRLTVTYALSSITTSALRSRTKRSFHHRCERLRKEIVAVSSDTEAATLGLEYLLEAGVTAVGRSRILRSCSAYSDAEEVTKQFCSLNQPFALRQDLGPRLIEQLEAWSAWLLSISQPIKEPANEAGVISKWQARGLVRLSVDAATMNLRTWRTSSEDMPLARASVRLIQDIAAKCKKYHVRVSFIKAAEELADCSLHKAAGGSDAEFNLGIRGLMNLISVIESTAEPNLGNRTSIKILARLLTELKTMTRDTLPISPWVLNELHDVTDRLSVRYDPGKGAFKQYLTSLGHLSQDEIIRVLKNSPDMRHRNPVFTHGPWQSVVLNSVRDTQPEEVAMAVQKTAISVWADGGELVAMIGLVERLADDYADSGGRYTLPLLESAVDGFRLGFQQHPITKEVLWQRRLRYEHKAQRRSGRGAGKIISPDVTGNTER